MKEEVKTELKSEVEALEATGRSLTELEKASLHYLRMHLELRKEQMAEAERVRLKNMLKMLSNNFDIGTFVVPCIKKRKEPN